MDISASDVMRRKVLTVHPEMTLPELEKYLLAKEVSGAPVVENDNLVGTISRSDVVRQLCSERELAERTSDFFWDESGFHEVPLENLQQVADRVGERIEELTVRDVMIQVPLVVSPHQPIREVAQKLTDHRIHRVPVTDDGKLVGIITTLDLVRLIAEGRMQ